jgi:hypothetical protein
MTAEAEPMTLPSGSDARQERRSPVERVIESLANALGNGIGLAAESGILFLSFAMLWIAFGAALILTQGSIHDAWHFIRGLPLIVQAVVWVLFLPLMVGMWIWETTWPIIVRLILVAGVAGWNLLVFLPRTLDARP